MARHWDERLLLRFPGLARLLGRRLTSLPVGSPIRRRALKRFVSRVYEAFSRGDSAPILLLVHPEVDIRPFAAELTGIGLPLHPHGHEGVLAWIQAWRDEWADYDERPEEVIDLGDRVIVRSTISARGQHSGVPTNRTVGNCLYLTDGLVTRWDPYINWTDLVKAHGLDRPA